MLKQILAFVVRDFRMLLSYKLAFISQYIYMTVNLFFLYFIISFGVGELGAGISTGYGVDPMAFILLGTIVWSFIWSPMSAASMSIRQEMLQGTFEPIFLTPTSPIIMVIAYTVWGLIMGSASSVFFIILGSLVFDISFHGSYINAFLLLFLSVLMMFGFGLIIAGLSIYYKMIGELVSIIQFIAMFFCEVYFPISYLPPVLQTVAKFMPFYYPMKAIRIAMGQSSDPLSHYLLILIIITIVLVTIGLVLFYKLLNKARMSGSLGQY